MKSEAKVVDLLIASDERASIGLLVAVYSALLNLGRECELRINLIDCGIKAKTLEMIKNSLSSTGKPYSIVRATLEKNDLKSIRVGEVGPFTYARLLAGDLFPDLTKAIYLDTDIVVNRNLDELYEYNLDGAPIGAVQDRFTPTVSHELSIPDWEQRGLDGDKPYFNAGVLLIDFAVWNKEGIGHAAMRFAQMHHDICVRWDQTALNILLTERWKPLEVHWNYMVYSNIGETWVVNDKNFHITGQPKQWDMAPRTNAVLQEMFFGYLDQTAFKGWRPWTEADASPLRMKLHRTFPWAHENWKKIKGWREKRG